MNLGNKIRLFLANHGFYILGILLASIFITGALFLIDPPVWPDEAIYAETAKNILVSGELKTTVFGNLISGLNYRSLWYPPLYFYFLALVMKVFGSSIVWLRFTSVCFGFLSVLSIYSVGYLIFKSRKLAFAASMLMLFDPFFGRAMRVARMDALAFFLLTISLLAFVFYLKKKRWQFLLFVGFLNGIAILNHPLGLIMPVVETVVLLFPKGNSLPEKVRQVIFVNLGPLLAVMAWLAFIGNDIALFWAQYALQFERKAASVPFLITFLSQNGLWKWLLFLHGGVFFSALALFFFTKSKELFLLLSGFAVSFAVLMWGKEMWYLLYFQPFASLLAIYLFSKVPMESKTFHSFAAVVLGTFFILYGQFFLQTTMSVSPQTNYARFGNKISAPIPQNARVLLSTIPDPYFELQYRQDLTLFEFPTVPVNGSKYRKFIESMDYIVYNFPADKTLSKFINEKKGKMVRIESGSYQTVLFKNEKN